MPGPITGRIPWNLVSWALLKRKGLQPLITGYELPVIEVDGEFGDIIKFSSGLTPPGRPLRDRNSAMHEYYNSRF